MTEGRRLRVVRSGRVSLLAEDEEGGRWVWSPLTGWALGREALGLLKPPARAPRLDPLARFSFSDRKVHIPSDRQVRDGGRGREG